MAISRATSAFPNPVNLGMSWDTELVEVVGTAIGDEKRALFMSDNKQAGK